MDQRSKERFDTYRSFFEHPGWDLLCKEYLDAEIETIPERVFRNSQNWEEVLAGRAAYSKLVELRSIPHFVEAQHEEALSEGEIQE